MFSSAATACAGKLADRTLLLEPCLRMMLPASALASVLVPLLMLHPFALTDGKVPLKLVEVVKAVPQLGAHSVAALLAQVLGESPTQFTGSCEGLVSSPFQEIHVEWLQALAARAGRLARVRISEAVAPAPRSNCRRGRGGRMTTSLDSLGEFGWSDI